MPIKLCSGTVLGNITNTFLILTICHKSWADNLSLFTFSISVVIYCANKRGINLILTTKLLSTIYLVAVTGNKYNNWNKYIFIVFGSNNYYLLCDLY